MEEIEVLQRVWLRMLFLTRGDRIFILEQASDSESFFHILELKIKLTQKRWEE